MMSPCSKYTADELLSAFSEVLCPGQVPEGQECRTPLR